MQIDSALTTPTPATVDPISEPPPRSSSLTTCCLLPRYSRKQLSNDDLIASIDQVGQKLVDCLSLTESALTTPFRRRPPFGSDLSEADWETLGDTTTIHQDALRDKFADQRHNDDIARTTHSDRLPRRNDDRREERCHNDMLESTRARQFCQRH